MNYISEAEALSEIYDDNVSVFEPHTKSERRAYVDAKSRAFKKCDIGKFVVVQKPRYRGVVTNLYLVDRNITKRFWWSPSAYYAMVFDKESAAKIQATKYRHNNVRVKKITPNMARRNFFISKYKYD